MAKRKIKMILLRASTPLVNIFIADFEIGLCFLAISTRFYQIVFSNCQKIVKISRSPARPQDAPHRQGRPDKIGPARTVAAVVGKAADIKPLLAKFGTWEEKKITDPAGG